LIQWPSVSNIIYTSSQLDTVRYRLFTPDRWPVLWRRRKPSWCGTTLLITAGVCSVLLWCNLDPGLCSEPDH